MESEIYEKFDKLMNEREDLIKKLVDIQSILYELNFEEIDEIKKIQQK